MKIIAQIVGGIIGLIFIAGIIFGIIWCWDYIFSSGGTIKGSIYVTTRGGSAVKMAGVRVFILREHELRKHIQEINGTIKSSFYASLESAGVKEGDMWILEEKASCEAKLVNDMIIYPNKSEFCWNETDSDGNFVFNYLKAGDYLVLARGTRELGRETEYFVWSRKAVVERESTTQTDLNNRADLLNGDKFIESTDDTGLPEKEANNLKQGISDGTWAGVLIKKYGLNLPALY